jgi:hypothetical protein
MRLGVLSLLALAFRTIVPAERKDGSNSTV